MKEENKQISDFYYSHRQQELERSEGRYIVRKFKGICYTTCCKAGEDHGCRFNDMSLIGSGTFDHVIITKY